MTPTAQQKAFLDMLAYSEIGPALLAKSDNGYNVLVGSTAAHPLLFSSYADHPNVLNASCNSTAAGRYQLLHRFWTVYQKTLKLPDFSPASQDAVALQQIRECGVLAYIETGHIDLAIKKCAHIWASLPGAGYGQHENKMIDLQAAFVLAKGKLA